jgi:hypothetical protein
MSTNPLPGPQGPRPAPPLARPLGSAGMPAQAGPAGMPPPGTQPGLQGSPQGPPGDEDDGPAPAISTNFLLFNAMPSWAVSGVVHFIGVIILALINVTPPPQSQQISTVSPPTEKEEEVEEFKEEKMEINVTETTVAATSSDVVAALTSDVVETTDTPSVAMDVDAAPVHIELSDFGEQTAPKNDLMAQVGAVTGTGVAGRGEAQRGQMVAKYGGNDASEAAVAAALKWFAAHQMPDGGWNFDHRLGPCNGRCGDGGRMTDCRTGATAMALLPFLGAGQTHKVGKYRPVVEKGLYFLTSQMKITNRGGVQCGDLAQGGGSMYSHGLASIVLCEAYAMTHDKGLMVPAQLSLNHIMYAQDPVGGGWRYAPRQAGDTSVVGWQLMALKSGHMAYLKVDPNTIVGAVKFLDTVGAESGAFYGYTDPGKGQATTAVGLLCRMYLGWKKENPALQRGVQYLSDSRPSKGNMYYNYYATQVLRQNEGEQWDKWNKEMRDWLVESQDKNGHQTGSWHMKGDHGSDSGGRIYCTSMATMILEVYYRHMPLYGKQAAEDDFPLK